MRFLVVFMGVYAVLCGETYAQEQRSNLLNDNTVGVVAGGQDALPDAMALAQKVDHVDALRVLPIAGQGSLQALNDLLFLKSVDAAILSSDSLIFAQQNGLYEDETQHLFYLAKLDSSPLVVVARDGITELGSLKDKRVATGGADHDSYLSAVLILGLHSISYVRSSLSGEAAIAALKANEIDAAFFTGSEAREILKHLDGKSGLHILPLPYDDRLAQAYTPALLTEQDSPSLLKGGTVVESLSAAKILAVAVWPDLNQHTVKIERFNTGLNVNYYKEIVERGTVNLHATVPGWQLYEKMQVLTENRARGRDGSDLAAGSIEP